MLNFDGHIFSRGLQPGLVDLGKRGGATGLDIKFIEYIL
jgi:hypothetical protein